MRVCIWNSLTRENYRRKRVHPSILLSHSLTLSETAFEKERRERRQCGSNATTHLHHLHHLSFVGCYGLVVFPRCCSLRSFAPPGLFPLLSTPLLLSSPLLSPLLSSPLYHLPLLTASPMSHDISRSSARYPPRNLTIVYSRSAERRARIRIFEGMNLRAGYPPGRPFEKDEEKEGGLRLRFRLRFKLRSRCSG